MTTAVLIFAMTLSPASDPKPSTTISVAARHLAAEAAARGSIDSREIERRFAPGDRSAAMITLYGSLTALGVLDVISTRAALARGATEANPLLKGTAGQTAPSLALKGLATASTIYLVNRLSKRSRKAAIATLIVANAVSAAVVAHNVRQGR